MTKVIESSSKATNALPACRSDLEDLGRLLSNKSNLLDTRGRLLLLQNWTETNEIYACNKTFYECRSPPSEKVSVLHESYQSGYDMFQS